VSVESPKYFVRVDDLRHVPAAIRFLSLEPLLEPLSDLNLTGIDWVIVGGESGPGARRMQAEWANEISGICRQAKVPFFFKQWGGIWKGKTGRVLNDRTYDEYPDERLIQIRGDFRRQTFERPPH
jgi:protein gp37